MTVSDWGDCPAEVRAAMEPYIARWACVLPSWCQYLSATWCPGQEAELSIEISHYNRWAQLRITGHWFSNTPEEREACVVHEFVHVCMQPLNHAAERLVEELTEEDSPLRGLAAGIITDGLECSVEDTARAIMRVRAA